MSRSASAYADDNDEEMVNRPQRARAATSYKEDDEDDDEDDGMPKKRKASSGKSRSKKSRGDSDDDENTPPDSTKSKSKRAKKMPSSSSSSSSSSAFQQEEDDDDERNEMDADSDHDMQQRHHKRTDYEAGQILSIKVTGKFYFPHTLSSLQESFPPQRTFLIDLVQISCAITSYRWILVVMSILSPVTMVLVNQPL